MKHLLKTILLVGLLCLAGCKEEEEPQSVAFSIHEKTLGDEGDGFYDTPALKAHSFRGGMKTQTDASRYFI